jgi:hypothetical protein
MDWPVIGALTGVTVLAGIVGVGAYVALSTAPSPVKSARPPVLLGVPSSRPAADTRQKPEPRLALSPSLPGLTVYDGNDDTAIRPGRPLNPAPRLRLEPPFHSGRLPDPDPKLLAAPRPDRERVNVRPPVVVAKPAPRKPDEEPHADPYGGRVMTAATIRRVRVALRLMPEQAQHWHAIEPILHEIGRAQIAQIKSGRKPEVGTGPMMRLYYAAQPLLGTLRPDQKERVRSLARSLGYANLASML